MPLTISNGNAKPTKSKAQHQSSEQAAADADDEQERDKNIPTLYDVADVVWVKMGGHPWYVSCFVSTLFYIGIVQVAKSNHS
jgi:hypothetical protein